MIIEIFLQIKIGEHLDRQAQDCIQMEKQMKSNLNSVANSSLNSASWNQKASTILNNKGEPTITTRLDVEKSEVWSQEQQALLEKALKEISKDIPNRWDKIADTIPNKTKVIFITIFLVKPKYYYKYFSYFFFVLGRLYKPV